MNDRQNPPAFGNLSLNFASNFAHRTTLLFKKTFSDNLCSHILKKMQRWTFLLQRLPLKLTIPLSHLPGMPAVADAKKCAHIWIFCAS